MGKKVSVDVEYCAVCDTKPKCLELMKIIKESVPETEVVCHRGRQGSFEVKINGILVFSRLKTLALPEFNDIVENVKEAYEGKPLKQVSQQPITNCTIM